MACEGPENEIQRIARFLVGRHIDGVPTHELQLAFPRITDNIDLAREVLTQYGVPVSVARDEPLGHRLPVRNLLAILTLFHDGFDANAQLDLLHTLPSSARREGAGATKEFLAEDVERFLFEHHLIHASPTLVKRACEAEAGHGNLPPSIQHWRKWLDCLPNESEGRSPAGWLPRLHQLANYPVVEDEQESLRNFLKEVGNALRLLEREDPRVILLPELLALLTTIAETAQVTVRTEAGGVAVSGLRDALDTPCGVLVVAGMTDDNIPHAGDPDPFFSEKERRALGLRTSQDEVDDDRARFEAALKAARVRVLFTYPSRAGSRRLVRSRFLERLKESQKEPPPAEHPEPRTLREWSQRVAENLHARIEEPGKDHLPLPGPPANRPSVQRIWLAMGASWERQIRPRANPFDGCVGGGLRTSSGTNLSVSALETLVHCPFRYALHYRLRILPREELDEEGDLSQTGSWVHAFLEEYYRQSATGKMISDPSFPPKSGLLPGSIPEEKVDTLFHDALAYADREVPRDGWLPPGIRGRALLERYLGSGDRPGAGALRELVGLERERVKHLRIVGIEVPFGSHRRAPGTEIPTALRANAIPLTAKQDVSFSVALNGRIDRLDQIDRPASEPWWVVTDYKTRASNLRDEDWKEGYRIQLPMYAHMLKTAFPEVRAEILGLRIIHVSGPGAVSSELLVYAYDRFGDPSRPRSGDGLLAPTEIMWPDKKQFGNASSTNNLSVHVQQKLTQCVERGQTALDNLALGDMFPNSLEDKDGNCRFDGSYCEYRTVCRFYEARRSDGERTGA